MFLSETWEGGVDSKTVYGQDITGLCLSDLSEGFEVTTLPYVMPFDGFVSVNWQRVGLRETWFPFYMNGVPVDITTQNEGISYSFSCYAKKGSRLEVFDENNSKLIAIFVYKI